MSEKLEQIKKQIENAMQNLQEIQTKLQEAESKFAALMDDRKVQREKLAERKEAQKRAILAEKDAGKIEKEIVEIQTRLSGLQNALKAQGETLAELRTQKQKAESQFHFEQAEQAHIEAEGIQAEIHALLADVFRKTKALDEKDREYRRHVKQVDKKLVRRDVLRTRGAIENFRISLVSLLDAIHPAMLVDKNSPNKDSMRKLLNIKR
jgi:DNA repair exonuclease SbcCD ATPase subunit